MRYYLVYRILLFAILFENLATKARYLVLLFSTNLVRSWSCRH